MAIQKQSVASDTLPRYRAGATYTPRHMRKGVPKSQTLGKSKREDTCRADFMEKFMARCSRSYKHPGYIQWSNKTKKENGMRVD